MIDAATRHQIFVQRYAAGRERQAQVAIDRMIAEVSQRLSGELTEYSQARLSTLLADLRIASQQLLEALGEDIKSEAIDFAEYEAQFNQKMMQQGIDADVSVPAPAQLSAAIYTSPMKLVPRETYSIADALNMFTNKKANQIVQTIKDGVALGDTNATIQTKLRELGVLQKQQAATLTRTITNHVSNEARYITLFENQDLMEGYEWVATLDSRTTLICGSRDGIVYEFLSTNPRPPAHFSCRSTIVPKVKPEYDLAADVTGDRPSKGAAGKQTVSASTNYGSWLSRQPAGFQDEILGTSRGKLFRAGGLKIDKFVDSTGAQYTLDELRKLEPLAFERAGL